jgi:ATP-binding cassette, subfamily B, multidrug efflux pump
MTTRITTPPRTLISDRSLLALLARFLLPQWRSLLAVAVMLAGVTALSLLPPYLIQQAVDGPIAAGDLNGLLPIGVIYIGSIVLLFFLRFGYTYVLQTAGQNALVALRQTLFTHILRQDMRFFNTTPVGQLISRMSSDIEALTELLSTSIVMVLSNLITLLGIIIVMLSLNWRLALLGLAVLPIMVGITIFFRKRIREAATKYHGVVGDYLAYINEQFNGMMIIQLFGLQPRARREFDGVNQRVRDVHMEWRDSYTYYASALQIMTTIGLAIVLYGGGQGVLAGWATIGMLIAFVEYSRRSFEPLLMLAEQFAQIQTALAAGERIARMLAIEPTIGEPTNLTPRTHLTSPPTPSPRAERGFPESQSPHVSLDSPPLYTERGRGGEVSLAIALENVHFAYEPDAPVLRGVTLRVPVGQRVAIVGATGAGKTSLAGLLTRFYDVQQGRVLINGVDVREMPQAQLRQLVTVVPQNPYCFEGTIADNLRLFNDAITDADMQAAARLACAEPFILALPSGYDHLLLAGGAELSQGQRQLLALARALLHSPDSILVLDEATSNIDTETESLIQAGLAHALAGRTSIIIAHRLSTVRDADRILVMRRGQIIEDGTHDELVAQGGLYARLYRRQFAVVGGD